MSILIHAYYVDAKWAFSFLCLCYLCIFRQTNSAYYVLFIIYFIIYFLYFIYLFLGSHLTVLVRDTSPSKLSAFEV